MKIAILCFGQPRFLDLTHEYIKQEFNIPGHDVDYFFHLWRGVGYNPEDSINSTYDTVPDLDKLVQSFNPKMWILEDYKSTGCQIMFEKHRKWRWKDQHSLVDLCNAWSVMNDFVSYNRDTPIPNSKRLEYFFGQHYSIQKCFNLIEQYEELNGFKYDIVIKIRTDIVYRTPNLYKSPEVYDLHKVEHYTDFPTDYPCINVKGLRINRLQIKENTWKGQDISCFYKGKYSLPDEDYAKKKKSIKFDLNTRLCFNDWTIIANRAAAHYYFGRWFETYLITYGEDLLYRKDRYWYKSQSDHTLQGHIALYNDIKVNRVNRRDMKLVREDKLEGEKSKDSLSNKAVVPSNNEIDLDSWIWDRWKPKTKTKSDWTVQQKK